jgi:hypothetical protein
VDVEPEVAQPTGDMAVVGIDGLAGQDLIACAQNLDAHGSPFDTEYRDKPRQPPVGTTGLE